MTISRRNVLTGIGASTLLSACGGDGGSGVTGTVVTPAPAPTPSPVPSPTPTPAPVPPAGPTAILTTGMSVFQGADIVGPNYPDREAFMRANAPVRYFVDRLQALRNAEGGPPVTERNVAVGGSFDNDTPGQYAGAGGSHNLVFLGLAMNSGSAYGVHGRGPNAAFTRGVLHGLLARIKADGAQPILCNTIHPWPERITPQNIQNALFEGVAWPPESATLYGNTSLRFDAAADEIRCEDSAFGTGPGRFLTAGSQLRIIAGGGRNEGRTLQVAERLSPDRLRIRTGEIAESGSFGVFAQHRAPDLEPILDPPPSRQRQNRDWGTGTAVDGLASYHLWNNMLGQLAEETDTLLFDLEYRGFAWVARHGWESVYVSTYAGVRFETFNHPQLAAQSAIYGGLMRHAAELFHRNALPKGYARLRGPEV